MQIHRDIAQGTPEWMEMRSGKFTASIAGKLLTPTGRQSVSYKEEMGRVIAESMYLQEPEANIETYWMARGTELEAEARRWFTVETGFKIEQVAFVEDGLLGASPDGLFCPDIATPSLLIALELKVPKPSTHIKWLLDGELPKEHIAQVHFTMALLDAPYGYFMSYSPGLAPLIIKVMRSDYTESMKAAMDNYRSEFMKAYVQIKGQDYAEV
jgi:hypothetical protein